MAIKIIVAIAENGVIGKDNDIPWRGKLPADIKRFKDITEGSPVIMGRNTYESIPTKFRPLPNRTNIVLTSLRDYVAPGALVMHSLQEAITMFAHFDLFIIGGAQVYREALPYTNEILLTIIHNSFEGDTSFPPIDPSVWEEVERENYDKDEKNQFPYSFCKLIARRRE